MRLVYLTRKFSEYVRTVGLRSAFARTTTYMIDEVTGRNRRSRELRARILALDSVQDRFETVHQQNYWGDVESRSGSGSTAESTSDFRPRFEEILRDLDVRTLFDAPCGDWNWMKSVTFPAGMTYIGGDIVRPLIEEITARHGSPQIRFRVFNIIEDAFPPSDLWLCRDALFHFSLRDIRATLQSFVASEARYALLTSHPYVTENREIVTGDFRPLNLTASPINLPQPTRQIDERPRTRAWNDPPRILGLWTRDQIRDALG